MDEGILLEVLAYGGLLLTTISSAWGLLHETTTKDERGRKRLTGAGRIALGLIIGGLFISMASRIVKNRVEEYQSEQQVAAERLRSLRLASSSQPLQSIRIRWVFNGLSADAVEELRAGFRRAAQTFRDDDNHKYQADLDRRAWRGDVFRSEVIYPWFFHLATGEWLARPHVILRVPLYESEAVVLPLGSLPLVQPSAEHPGSWNLQSELLRQSAAGIDTYDFIYADPAEFDDEFFSRRERLPGLQSSVGIKGESLIIKLWIEADSLHVALDKISSDLTALAQLPQRLDLLVLAKMGGLPWPASNFAGRQRSAATKFSEVKNPPFTSASLDLIPNGVEELGASYTVTLEGRGSLVELPGPESSNSLYCSGASLRAIRVDSG